MNGNLIIQTPSKITKPDNHFIETWKAQILFSIGTLESVLVDLEKWDLEKQINYDQLAKDMSYMIENGMGELVDEMMVTGVRS